MNCQKNKKFWSRIIERISEYSGYNLYCKAKLFDGLSEQHTKTINQCIEINRDYGQLSKKTRGLELKVHEQNAIIRDLTNKSLDLNDQVLDYEKRISSLNEDLSVMKLKLAEYQQGVKNSPEYKELKERSEGVLKEIGATKKRISDTLKVCREIYTAREVIETRCNENSSANQGLNDWIKYQEKPYKEKVKQIEEEVKKLRNSVYRIAISSVIQNNSKFAKVPFIYYDFIEKKLIHNDYAEKYFNVPDKKNFTLKDLLKSVRKEDLEGTEHQMGILDSIEKGVKLKHFKAQTSGDKPRDLRLTSIPFGYEGKYLGVGIFLWDPRVSTKSFRDYRASRVMEKVIEDISYEFDKIKKEVKEQNVP